MKTGRINTCRVCCSIRVKAARARNPEKFRNYVKTHVTKEQRKAILDRYKAKYPGRVKMLKRAWVEKNRERINEKRKQKRIEQAAIHIKEDQTFVQFMNEGQEG